MTFKPAEETQPRARTFIAIVRDCTDETRRNMNPDIKAPDVLKAGSAEEVSLAIAFAWAEITQAAVVGGKNNATITLYSAEPWNLPSTPPKWFYVAVESVTKDLRDEHFQVQFNFWNNGAACGAHIDASW